MKEILLYCDEGADLPSYRFTLKGLEEEIDASKYTIRTVDHRHLLHSDWESRAELVVIGGGRDRPYHARLQGEGNRRLLRFIESGGTYLGICAGAYYGAGSIEYEKGTPSEIIEKRELAFFPGKAVGPVFNGGAIQAKVCWQGKEEATSIHFHGGCTFISPEKHSNTTVLANYKDVNLPAIVCCKIGRGKAILSGVHPEFAIEQDSERLIFWKTFLNYILI